MGKVEFVKGLREFVGLATCAPLTEWEMENLDTGIGGDFADYEEMVLGVKRFLVNVGVLPDEDRLSYEQLSTMDAVVMLVNGIAITMGLIQEGVSKKERVAYEKRIAGLRARLENIV